MTPRTLEMLPIALVWSLASCAAQTAASEARPTSHRAKLPDLSLETIDGDRFVLSKHVGRSVVVMNFWATWCAPCLDELPHLDALYKRWRGHGLVVVAIAMDEPSTIAQVVPTARRLGLEMPVALDPGQRAVQLYNRARSAPLTVIIDRKGTIVESIAGYDPGGEIHLADKLRELLAGNIDDMSGAP